LQAGAEPKADYEKYPNTWCQKTAYRIACSMGYDITPLLDKRGIGYTFADDMYNNAVSNAGKGDAAVVEVTQSMAQELANKGIVVIALAPKNKGALHGHAAIVTPTKDAFDNKRGPLVGEAGQNTQIVFANEAFWRYKMPEKYFKLSLLQDAK